MAQEISRILAEQGSITIDRVAALWSFSPADARIAVFSVLPLVERELGFRVIPVDAETWKVASRDLGETAAPGETGHLSRYELSDWQVRGVQRLAELFKHEVLESLLGPLVSSARATRKLKSGQSRRGTKEELGTALVIAHDRDLLTNESVRRAVAAASGIPAPAKWFPGKRSALEFAVRTGFPVEYAGEASADPPPDYEILNGIRVLAPLEDFQRELAVKMRAVIASVDGRAIITLPTGAGKTRVAVETLCDAMRDSVARQETGIAVWLAHTEELCEQACACFADVWNVTPGAPRLYMFRFWGKRITNLTQHEQIMERANGHMRLLVTTPQRFHNLITGKYPNGQKLLKKLNSEPYCLIVDEAHRAGAPTYQRIIERFADCVAPIVGLTATPYRMEYAHEADAGTRELFRTFERLIEADQILGTDPRATLQARGVLSTPNVSVIQTSLRMVVPESTGSGLATDEDDSRIDRALAERADSVARRLHILTRLLPIASQRTNSVLYFGPTVHDAQSMAFMLRDHGIAAAVLHGDTRESTRRSIVADFRSGQIRVLCNCEVLTTGFDAPRITHVVVARPTVSQVLYEQMVGRGLRGPLFGGTAECEIIDVEDEIDFGAARPRLGYQGFRRVWNVAPVETVQGNPG